MIPFPAMVITNIHGGMAMAKAKMDALWVIGLSLLPAMQRFEPLGFVHPVVPSVAAGEVTVGLGVGAVDVITLLKYWLLGRIHGRLPCHSE